MAAVTASRPSPHIVAELGKRLAALRLCEALALDTMRHSIERPAGSSGLRAARALSWPTMAITTADVADGIEAKMRLAELHEHSGRPSQSCSLVRPLYRDDKLSRLRDRAAGSARELGVPAAGLGRDARPRGPGRPAAGAARAARGDRPSRIATWQPGTASAVVIRRGLTVRQTERLVAELREQPQDARARWIAQRFESAPTAPASEQTRTPRGEADGMVTDIATLERWVHDCKPGSVRRLVLGVPRSGPSSTGSARLRRRALLARTVATVLGQE